jgi:hypothetical protein
MDVEKDIATMGDSDSAPFLNTSCASTEETCHETYPPSSKLQQLFRECISHPDGAPPLCELDNLERNKIQVNGMMICYHPSKSWQRSLIEKLINERGPKSQTCFKQVEEMSNILERSEGVLYPIISL